MQNIPEVKLGIIAVSRDCFPIALSEQRRKNIMNAYAGELYECPVTVENETDMQNAVKDVNEHGCNALVVFLGNFNSERYHEPAVPLLILMAAYAMTHLRRKDLKIFYIYCGLLFVALVVWNWLKLSARGLA